MSTIFVTGCSSGIGFAVALHFSRLGETVYAGVRDASSDGALQLAALASEEALALTIIPLDVIDNGSCEQAIQRIYDEAGAIDVLVNNAGIGLVASLEETTEADLRALMEVNYFAPVFLMQQVLPAMREARSGAIINVTSMAGRICMPFNPAYAASKFALEAASEAMAVELAAFDVRVALVEPGVIETAMQNKVTMPPSDSPYADLLPRSMQVYGGSIINPTQPIEVAKVIQQAIETDTPQLRYTIGNDAKRVLTGRTRMSDKEWLGLGDEMTADEFAQRCEYYFGAEDFGVED